MPANNFGIRNGRLAWIGYSLLSNALLADDACSFLTKRNWGEMQQPTSIFSELAITNTEHEYYAIFRLFWSIILSNKNSKFVSAIHIEISIRIATVVGCAPSPS